MSSMTGLIYYMHRYFLILTTFLFGLSFWCYEPLDPDLGWHLLGGLHVLDTGTVPHKDFINVFRNEWHDYHWLAQALFAFVYRQGGFSELMIFNGLLVGLLSLVIFLIAYEKESQIKSFLLWAYAFTCSILILSIRPQVLSIMGVALSLLALEKLAAKFSLVILFCISVILCNMHVYWIFVPILWGVYYCLPRIIGVSNSGNLALSWGGLLLLSLSGLICPYTFSDGQFTPASYTLILDYLDTPEILKTTISEFKSSLKSGLDAAMLILLFVGLLGYSLRKIDIKKDFKEIILALFGLFLAIFQIKFLPFLGIFGVPLLKKIISVPECPKINRAFLFAPVLALAVAIYTFPGLIYNEQNLRLMYPINACEFLSDKAGSERTLTSFEYGGWCMFGARRVSKNTNLRVMADGRTQQLPASYFEKLFKLFKILPGWNITLDTWKPNYAVLDKMSSLAQVLGFAKGAWEVVFEDENFVVFRRLESH